MEASAEDTPRKGSGTFVSDVVERTVTETETETETGTTDANDGSCCSKEDGARDLVKTEGETVTSKSEPTKPHSKPNHVNPWKKTVSFASDNNVTTNTNANGIAKLSFKDIIQEQEISEKSSSTNNVGGELIGDELMTQILETEEERMIRLAIEASLKDVPTTSTSISTSACDQSTETSSDSLPALIHPQDIDRGNCNDDDDDGINGVRLCDMDDDTDEDMKLAIQLSLATMNTNSNGSSHISGSGNNSAYAMDMDVKPSAMGQITKFHSTTEKIPPDLSLDETLGHRHYKPASIFHADNTVNHNDNSKTMVYSTHATAAATSASSTTVDVPTLSLEEQEAITRAILAADDEAEAQSLKLAMELQAEEDLYHDRRRVELLRNNNTKSNVRTLTQSEFQHHVHGYGNVGTSSTSVSTSSSARQLWGQDDYERHNEYYGPGYYADHTGDGDSDGDGDGFQINASTPNKTWSRIDRNTIVGPNNEIRTKHDVALKNRSNAERLLGSDARVGVGGGGGKKAGASVGDAAFNSFNRSIKNAMKRSVIKGVERSGTGRAENMNEKTRGGAMDGNVRLLITKAINSGLIGHCNGVVKEGKEAIVYHAETGTGSGTNRAPNDGHRYENSNGGFDVAVKVFKRIQEFKGRGEYMDNDPRYHGKKFRNAAKREQVELWAEKEYRNLIRASRGGVPVPLPLIQRENVLFMRFLGENGWPAPQLREVDLKRGSKKWTVLYCQTLIALRRLYHCARLVHADISEYNILVCPMSQVFDHRKRGDGDQKDTHVVHSDDLQIVLIDFGQAVERNHPSAMKYLRRDLSLIRSFFAKQQIATLTDEEGEDFIVKEPEVENYGSVEEMDEENKDSDDDSDICAEKSTEWRHNIKGWDAEKDLAWLEQRLAHLMKNAKI